MAAREVRVSRGGDPPVTGQDSLKTRRTLNVNGKAYDYFSVEAAGEALGVDFTRLPYSMKVLLENLLRAEDGGRRQGR